MENLYSVTYNPYQKQFHIEELEETLRQNFIYFMKDEFMSWYILFIGRNRKECNEFIHQAKKNKWEKEEKEREKDPNYSHNPTFYCSTCKNKKDKWSVFIDKYCDGFYCEDCKQEVNLIE